MSNNGWITERLPTVEDKLVDGRVWAIYDGEVGMRFYSHVEPGTPWQPIPLPSPYVKPKRWTVEWGGENADFFTLYDSGEFTYYLPMLFREHAEAAQRIADIYNEVMP